MINHFLENLEIWKTYEELVKKDLGEDMYKRMGRFYAGVYYANYPKRKIKVKPIKKEEYDFRFVLKNRAMILSYNFHEKTKITRSFFDFLIGRKSIDSEDFLDFAFRRGRERILSDLERGLSKLKRTN